MNITQVKKNNSGFITLIAMLVVSMVGISITVALLLAGVSSSKTGGALEQSRQAGVLATACANNALERVRKNPTFTGTGNLVMDIGACSYTVSNTGGETRIINSTGNVGSVVKKEKIQISAITPKIVVSSWQELADF